MAGAAVASGGDLVVQPMLGFGAGWGGNAQLFWRPPGPGANAPGFAPTLTLAFSVPSAGAWDLTLAHTLAPDYGRFSVEVAGREVRDIDGYGSEVRLVRRSLGRFELTAGRQPIVIKAIGKNEISSGFIVGVDRLELTLASGAVDPVRTIVGAPRAESVWRLSDAIPIHESYSLPLAGAAKLFRRPGDIYLPLDVALDPADRHFGVSFDFEALDSPRATGVVWQVSTHPFPSTLPVMADPLTPSGLVRSGVVAKRRWSFEVDFSALLAELGWRPGLERRMRSDAPLATRESTEATSRRDPSTALRDGVALRKKTESGTPSGIASAGDRPVDAVGRIANSSAHYFDVGGKATLYLRVLPIAGDEAAPRVVGYPSETATVTYGKRPPLANPFEGYEWRDREIPRLAVSSFTYTPMRTDTSWPKGCVHDQGGNDYWNPLDFLADAWDWASQTYADIKSFVLDTVNALLPFVPRGVLDLALDAALMAAGVPPELPNIDQLMEQGAGYLAEEAASQLAGPVGSAVTQQVAGELFGDAAAQMAASMTAEALQDAVQDELESRLQHEIEAQARAARHRIEAEAPDTICQTREYPPMLKLAIRNLENRRLSDVAITIADEAGFYRAHTPAITLDPQEDYVLVLPLTPDLWNIAIRSKVPPSLAMDAFWEGYSQATTRFAVSGPDVTRCLEHANGYVQECKKAPANDPRPLRFETAPLYLKNPYVQ